MSERIPDPMPYIYEPGDMGEFALILVTILVTGEPIHGRRMVRQPKYTGGHNANGSWTLARGWQHYRPAAEELP